MFLPLCRRRLRRRTAATVVACVAATAIIAVALTSLRPSTVDVDVACVPISSNPDKEAIGAAEYIKRLSPRFEERETLSEFHGERKRSHFLFDSQRGLRTSGGERAGESSDGAEQTWNNN